VSVKPKQENGAASSSYSSTGELRRRLIIDAGARCEPPSGAHSLLLEFGFGCPAPTGKFPAVHIPLPLMGAEERAERWWYPGCVVIDAPGPVSRATCDDFQVLAAKVAPEDCEDVRSATRQAYGLILDALAEDSAYGLVRMWNYLGGINDGNNDMERYRQFSIGRAEAFQDGRIQDGVTPVGTGIGTPEGSGLTIVGLASRRKFLPIENPLQVSAFNYPQQYGPSSPKFSRSGILSIPGGVLFLISGTAAVVGHESASPYQTAPQVKATLKNLSALAQAASERNGGSGNWALDQRSCVRVYLRNVSDHEMVRESLSEALAVPDSQVIYLQGDICRRELMIEIEACVVI
jgi:hypothetical protein